MDEEDHRTGGLVDDLVDQVQGVLRAVAEADERDVGSLPGGHGADLNDFDLARDDFVSEGGNDGRDEGQPILAFVGDQCTKMLGLVMAMSWFAPSEFTQLGLSELRPRALPGGCMVDARVASTFGERAFRL